MAVDQASRRPSRTSTRASIGRRAAAAGARSRRCRRPARRDRAVGGDERFRPGQLGRAAEPGGDGRELLEAPAEHLARRAALADLEVGQRTCLRTDIFPSVEWDGRITTINPEVDAATRNVRVRATFENRDGRLRPGMFANVEVLSSEQRPVLIIPATAVIFAPYGDSVFAIVEKRDAAGKTSTVVRQKFVRTGARRGDLVAVASGLEAGETVVTSGAFRLRNGAAVTVNNALAPKAQLAPKPTED
jgi:membrane fusion protein (multidrug efflux system)